MDKEELNEVMAHMRVISEMLSNNVDSSSVDICSKNEKSVDKEDE